MRTLFYTLTASALAAPAMAAQPLIGQPTDGNLGFQPAATRIMERVDSFHNYLLVIITLITLFVTALLIWVMVRYNKKANPEARKFSHNTTIEVIWTLVPALILVAIAGPSFSNLFYQDRTPDLQKIIAVSSELREEGNQAKLDAYLKNHFPEAAEKGFVNVKVQGNQWNWTYTYQDTANPEEGIDPLEFISNPLHKGLSSDEPVSAENPRLLAVDYPMVLPAGRYIRYYTAASDVIHSFTVPAFGIKTDAIPGRLNQGWFLVEQPGVYYGQCSELCGINHAYMPIEVRVVPEAQYERWLEIMMEGDYDAARQVVARIDPLETGTQLASTQ